VHAQSYAQQVWEKLQNSYGIIAGLGDYELNNYVLGKLDDDETDTWTFYFNANESYIVSGACDNDCPDLDLIIKTASGSELKRDSETDSNPLLEFTPTSSGRYQLEVKMYSCTSEPCYFGFGLFQK